MKKIAYIKPATKQKTVFFENVILAGSTNQPDLPIVDDDDDEDPRSKDFGGSVWED